MEVERADSDTGKCDGCGCNLPPGERYVIGGTPTRNFFIICETCVEVAARVIELDKQ